GQTQAATPRRTHQNPSSLCPHPRCCPYPLCALCPTSVAGSALEPMTERDWRQRGFPVAARESVRRLRCSRRLAFAQVGASCLSYLSSHSCIKIFTTTTEITVEKHPQMSSLSGIGAGFCAHKKAGGQPPACHGLFRYPPRSRRSTQTLCAGCPHGARSDVGAPHSAHAAGRPTRAWDQSNRLRLPMATSTSVRS